MDKQKAVVKMKQAIEKAAVRYGLNLTVYQGKIGFVDQEQRKIIALWEPQYSLKKDKPVLRVLRGGDE